MDNTPFNIYVEQLRHGNQIAINESVSPDFLDVKEKDLSFTGKVKVQGETYLAVDTVVIHLKLTAHCIIPCAICNESVPVEIYIDNFYHAQPLAEIKGGIYNFRDDIREAILLEVPPFTECNSGKCLKRKEIEKYLATPEKGNSQEEGYHPFADL